MTMKYGKWKRIIAGIMTAAIIATAVPSGVHATEENGVESTAAEVFTEETEETVTETQEAASEEEAVEETTEEEVSENDLTTETETETKTDAESAENDLQEEYSSSDEGTSETGVMTETVTEDEGTSETGVMTETVTEDEGTSEIGVMTETVTELETDTEEAVTESETNIVLKSEEEVLEEQIDVRAGYDFVPRTTAPNQSEYGSANPYMGPSNCTYYAWGRARELLGYRPYVWQGNACDWWGNNDGYERGSTPRLGAILCWAKSNYYYYGHVAVVEAIYDDGTIDYSEASYNTDPMYSYPFKLQHVSINNLSRYGTLLGYIYLPGIPKPAPEPEPDGPDLPNGGTRTIMDGDYHIVSALDNTMCLDVDSYQTVNGANVHLCHSIDNPKQVFTVTWLGADKGYKIVCKNSGKCMDVEGASKKNGANVQQWEYVGGLNQQWVINEVDNGAYYTIQARGGSYYLDVYEGKATDGKNVQMWAGNGTDAQKWRFVPAQSQTVPNGDYHIVTEGDNSKCLNVENTNVQINSKIGQESAVFTLTYLGNGFYKIIHKQTGMSMDISRAEAYRGTNVQIIAYDGNPAQQWAIGKASDGIYYIQPRCSGHYLDVANAGTQEGTNVWTTVWMGGANTQKWKFVPAKKPKMQPPTAPYPDGAEVEAGTRFYLDTHDADEVYLTWDGTEPTRQSLAYSKFKYSGLAIFTQWKSYTLKAFAVKEGYEDSDIVTYTYKVISEETEPEKPSEPESSTTEESSKTEESSTTEESSATEESSTTEESGSTEESSDINDGVDDDPQDGVKWHYSEQKVTYKDLSIHGKITAAIKPKTYDGTPYKPTIKVTTTENGKTVTLTEGTDYRVLYFNNIHAGTATVTVRGNGVYKGTISRQFEIKKKPCKTLKVLADSMSKGTTAVPKVYVYDGAILLKENKDYTIDGITPNLTATKGKKQLYVKAVPGSDYEGTTTAKLTVYDADQPGIQGTVTDKAVKLSQTTCAYSGKACRPAAVVTVNGQTLTAGKDYYITYQNNKETGIAYAVITGKGAYVGSVVKEFTIKPSNGEFSLKKPITALTYNGKLQKPKLTVTTNGKTLKLNKDYTVTYTNNLHVTDRAKVTVRGKGNYAAIPTKTFYFIITPCPIKKASVKGTQGNLTITHAKHTLVEGVDYDVIYGETVGKNKTTVTIKAKEGSSFTGEVIKQINIR